MVGSNQNYTKVVYTNLINSMHTVLDVQSRSPLNDINTRERIITGNTSGQQMFACLWSP